MDGPSTFRSEVATIGVHGRRSVKVMAQVGLGVQDRLDIAHISIVSGIVKYWFEIFGVNEAFDKIFC